MIGIIQPLVYAVFVVSATLPRGCFQKDRIRSFTSYALGVFASMLVPVSCAPVLPLSSRLFLPMLALSVIIGGTGAARAVFTFAAVLSMWVLDRLTMTFGLPGERFSTEPLMMISRLGDTLPPYALPCAVLMFAVCGAALSAASRGAQDRCSSARFAFASLASVSLLPLDAAVMRCAYSSLTSALGVFLRAGAALVIYSALGHMTHAEKSGSTDGESVTS